MDSSLEVSRSEELLENGIRVEIRLAVSSWRELYRRLADREEVAVVVRAGPVDGQADGFVSSEHLKQHVLAPFSPVRLTVTARQNAPVEASPSGMQVGPLRLDFRGGQVWVGEKNVSVTARELAVLAYLADRTERAVSKSELLRDVWGEGGVNPNAVEVCIAKLRRRLEPLEEISILTVKGEGYCLSTFDAA
ncbi:winged helix-turn-helix domain-containing protein [Georgenia daeguensis]|uniref:OmpR/PhoB-type domain-containing protein n=1 Tax=Georgenia daeguensis TaxID=908355 RepID=A0ABP6UND5_9MICO